MRHYNTKNNIRVKSSKNRDYQDFTSTQDVPLKLSYMIKTKKKQCTKFTPQHYLRWLLYLTLHRNRVSDTIHLNLLLERLIH